LEVNGKKVKLQIWDTAGQERFKNITASYYRGGNGVLVVYDITDRDSFTNLTSWLIEIEKNANKNVFKLLIGNKNDLESERKVTTEEGKEFADSNGMKFIETSAKTADKVYEAFELLTQEIIKNNLNKDKVITNKGTERKIELNKGADLNKKKEKGCC
jgi:Ras-related protein Rab-1A